MPKVVRSLTQTVETFAPGLKLDHVQVRASDKFLQTAFESGSLQLKDIWILTTAYDGDDTRLFTLYGMPDPMRVGFLERNGVSVDYTWDHEWEVARVQATTDLENDARCESVQGNHWDAMQAWLYCRRADGVIL